MQLETLVYLGLGANLNDPIQQLVDARARLAAIRECRVLATSSFYLSSPVGYSSQPDFVNCVISLQTNLSAQELLSETQHIERQMGRVRDAKNQNAARLIDIDILIFGDEVCDQAELTLPHPRICERLFVLLPLAELLHNEAHSVIGSIPTLLASNQFEGQFICRLTV